MEPDERDMRQRAFKTSRAWALPFWPIQDVNQVPVQWV